jgi:hypothetical protein
MGVDSGKIGEFFRYIRGIPPFGELPVQNGGGYLRIPQMK